MLAAREAKIAIAKKLADRFEDMEAAARRQRAIEGNQRRARLYQSAAKALGRPQPRYAKRRSVEDLEPALAKLARTLPITAKRLRKLAAKGLAVRPGAKPASIAATEKRLGKRLSKSHRALLDAFDGGTIGEITFVGTAGGGARGDAELATLSKAWAGESEVDVIVAHIYRDRIVAQPLRPKCHDTIIVNGKCGLGSGHLVRACARLDLALDLVIKAGKI